MPTSIPTVIHFGSVAVLSGLLSLTCVVCPGILRSADLSLPVTGNLVGSVVDSDGVPQMGATVQLLNKYHQSVAKATTGIGGRFAFASLPADLYSLRASLASFLPVSRDRVAVKAGLDSVLQIHLATLVSSVEVSYIVPSSAMTDDWKWVLRSSNATRPVNRYLPVGFPEPDSETSSSADAAHIPLFSETHASVALTGGDGGPLDSDSSFSDFGTAFTVSTQVLGKNHLQVSGSFGQDAAASPSMALAAIYTRNDGSSLGRPPEVTFSALQVAGIGTVSGNSTNNLRSMSLGLYEVVDPLSRVHIEYGVTGESVDYVQHTSRISPFARMTVETGKAGQWIGSYTDGGRPDQLLRHSVSADTLESDSGDLSNTQQVQRLPQISSRNGRLVLQRTRSYEVGYRKVTHSRSYAVSGFSENVVDGRLSIAGDIAIQCLPNVLSDSLSRTSVYNTGRYQRTGYMASIDQRIAGPLELGLAYGRMGAFQAELPDQSAGGPRMLRQLNSNFAAANLKAVLPRVGTHIHADYGWIQSGTVMPRHIFTTQRASAAPGLNVYIRQPVPTFFGLPGRLEVTADLRNLLSQGYLPLNGSGRQMLIVQAPQSMRGGLNFIF